MKRTLCARSTSNTVGSYSNTSSSSSSCDTSTPLVCFHYFTQQLCELAALTGAVSGVTSTSSSSGSRRSNSPFDPMTITEEPATTTTTTTYYNRHKRRGKDGVYYNKSHTSATGTSAMNVPAAASNQAILATSPGSINNAQTATPKRRRKENGAGSPRVRYSPDKKSY